MRLSTKERFDQKWELDSNGCHLWTAALRRGYGAFRYEGRMRSAHVVAWELEHGPVPPGMELDHRCRVTRCVNVKHLLPIPHRENILLGASGFELTGMCLSGKHVIAEVGYYLDKKSGKRRCKACQRAAVLAWQRANPEKVAAKQRRYLERRRNRSK